MINPKGLTREEHYAKLKKFYPTIYSKRWTNNPQSIFYYDHPDFNGISEEVGIWTAETAWLINANGIIKTAYTEEVI